MPRNPRPPARDLALLALLPAAAACIAYAGMLGNGLAYDDFFLMQILDRWQGGWFERAAERRSLTFAVLSAARDAFGGYWPPGLHALSLAVHALASALAGVVGRALSGSARVGVATGVLFAVHPVHVEAVASFANLGDPLATVFALTSLLLWISRDGRPGRTVAALACAAMALAAKETVGAGLIPMLLVSDLLLPRVGRPGLAERLRGALPWIAPLLGVGVLALGFFGGGRLYDPSVLASETEGQVRGVAALLATSLAAVPEAFRLLFFPLTLSADYPPAPQAGLAAPRALAGVALLGAWLGIAAALARRRPLAAWSLLFVPLTYLPCTNLVPLTHFFVAERYLYLPSFGACLLLALVFDAGWTALARRPAPRIAWLAAGLAIVALAGSRTALRGRDWFDNVALAESALRAGTDTWRMRGLLAEGLVKWGDEAAALPHVRRAVELRPESPFLRYVLAMVLVENGKVAEARETVRAAQTLGVPSSFGSSRALYLLALSFLRAGLVEDGVDALRRAVQSDPGDLDSAEALVWALSVTQRAWVRSGDEARALAEKLEGAAAIRPRVLCASAAAAAEGGNFEEARDRAAACLRAAEARRDRDLGALAEALSADFARDVPARRRAADLAALLATGA